MALLIWAVDSGGYELTRDQKRIRRRGGSMVSYAIDIDSPDEPVHRQFGGFDMHTAALGRDVDQLLAFVHNHGLLGLDGNPKAEEEDIDELFQQVTRLYTIAEETPSAELSRQQLESFNLAFPMGLAVSLEKTDKVPRFTVKPRTLLSAIWLLTAQELSGQMRWRKCGLDGCDRWFYVVPGRDKRHDRKMFCSDSHRSLFSRHIRVVKQAAKQARTSSTKPTTKRAKSK